MALKFRRGTTAQKSGSLAFGEPYVNTDLNTLMIGGASGDITLSSIGTGSNLVINDITASGNISVAGNVSVAGQLTIGDATSDTVNVVASLSSSLIPSQTNAFDLGSANKIWRDLYISTGSIKFVAGNTVVKSLSLSTLTALETATGSSNTSLQNLNSFSASALTRLSALEVETANLELTSASVNTSVAALNSFSSSQLTQNSTLATYTGSINTRLTEISVVTSSLISSASVDQTRFTTLATYTGSVDTRFTTLATTTGSINTSLTNLNSATASLIVETTNLELFTASMSTTSNVRFASLGIGMAASGTSGRIDAAGDIVAFSTSDKNFKENIKPIETPIEKIRKISGNTYDWKSELKDIHGFEGNDVGVIAQEIEEVLPQLVTTRETGYKAVKYDKLVALLIEGIKEQQLQIESLQLEVAELKKQKGL
jgi:hypothetical protein